AVFVYQVEAAGAPDNIADGDTANTAGKCGCDRGQVMKVTFIYQVTGKGEQPFIGDGQADDAEHQQAEDGEMTVLRNKLENGFHVAQACEAARISAACCRW